MLKKINILRSIYKFIFYTSPQFFRFRLFSFISLFFRFCNDYRKYRKINNNKNFILSLSNIDACLTDRTQTTPLDPVYFYQDTWAAKKIFDLKPSRHVDVGSSAKTIGLLSQFVPVTMVDIRPLELTLKELSFIEGSILNLPFEDNSLETISSICVVEHIGLGRYGDPIDPMGSEKAIGELKRVVKKGGHIIISVPVDKQNIIYFNANRCFTRDYILSLFNGFKLIEERYQYGKLMYNDYDAEKRFGTGFYLLQKEH